MSATPKVEGIPEGEERHEALDSLLVSVNRRWPTLAEVKVKPGGTILLTFRDSSTVLRFDDPTALVTHLYTPNRNYCHETRPQARQGHAEDRATIG